MALSLLATKLHWPAPPDRRVRRPRLVERLDEGLATGHRLTLVSAPAGFGKTTCVSDWLAGAGLPVAWLALEPADDDPVRFFAYLVAALQQVDGSLGREIQGVLRSGPPPSLESLTTALLNDIAVFQRRFLLVLDDCQVIRDAAILQALGRVTANQPPNLHLVLLTREDPQLPLGRLRANNQLTEIRALDLRFSHSEADQFLNGLMALGLSSADVAALAERTEGWIAGLQLAGLSLRDCPDPARFVANLSGSHRHILSYLTEEVLSRLPADSQDFLLQTSILDRLSGELCDAVTGRASGAQLLERLCAANLFLVPLDDEQQWYRYHHLFRDLLQARLRQTLSGDAILALHARAATWYEQNGLAVDATNHALAAKDLDRAADLIEQHAYPLIMRGELLTPLRWLDSLPDDVIQRRPLSLVVKAWALTFAGAIQQVEPLLQQAEAQFTSEDLTPAARAVLGNAASIRAFFAAMTGNSEGALALAQRAEALLPESSIQARSLLPYTLAAAYRGQGQYDLAVEASTREMKMGEASGDLFIWATGVVDVANARRQQGRLREAGEVCRRALARIAEAGAESFGSLAKVDVALGEVLREQNALDEAHELVSAALARMQVWNLPTDRLFAHLALAQILEAEGNIAEALESLRTAKELSARYPVLMSLARQVDLCEVRLCLASQGPPEAERLLDGLRPGTGQTVRLREQELILLARLRLAQGRADEAALLLSPLIAGARAGGRQATLVEALALQSCVLTAQGDGRAALAVLAMALELAAAEGFVRAFVDLGPAMERLLASIAHQASPVTDYAVRLLAAFPGSQVPARPVHPREPAAGLVEPLTGRELEVLRLIAAGDSNQAIADRLVISVSAVKKHTGNIYGKLGTSSRTQAVARARQLGLLPRND